MEYAAPGEIFHNQGSRSTEQIQLLRAPWTQDIINFEGRWNKVTHAGINPLPVQRPIPIWMSAGGRANPIPADRVLGRLADG